MGDAGAHLSNERRKSKAVGPKVQTCLDCDVPGVDNQDSVGVVQSIQFD